MPLSIALGCALLALACVLSANERMADEQETVGGLGRFAFGPSATYNRAATAFDNGENETALAFSTSALASKPLDVRILAIIGIASLRAGNAQQADSAFRVAALLGWRNRETQRYWAAISLLNGAPDIAAQRIDAILRTMGPEQTDLALLAGLESTPKGRAALVDRLKLYPAWFDRYVQRTSSEPGANALANHLQTLEAAKLAGIDFNTDAIASLAHNFASRGYIATAKVVWQYLGPAQTSGQLLADGGFDHVRSTSAPSPFEWRLVPSSDASVAVASAPRPETGNALKLKYTGVTAQQVATQSTLLEPGAYTLSWHIVSDAGKAAPGYAAPRVTCNINGFRPLLTQRAAGKADDTQFDFVVPSDQPCRIQKIEILALPQAPGDRMTVWLDDVAIIRSADASSSR